MKKKLAFALFLLLIIAIAEVATTGLVYDYLGVWKLIAVYVVTTTLGALLLLSKIGFIKKLNNKIKTCTDDEELKKDIESAGKDQTGEVSPKYREFVLLSTQTLYYIFAWIAILIPGLVTDVAGYVLIVFFLARIKNIERMF